MDTMTRAPQLPLTRGRRPVLVLTASMGAGHTGAARQLGRRLSGRVPWRVVDLLNILPARIGPALRIGYAGMMRATPWLYEAIFQTFFVPHGRWQPNNSPLVSLAARRLREVVAACDPCAVLSTFHLAGQTAALLRAQGALTVPSIVAVTEPAAHLLWCPQDTDLFLCPYPWVAHEARRLTGRPALAPGPIIDESFVSAGSTSAAGGEVARTREALGLSSGEHAVLISGGSWGVGRLARTVRQLTGLPVVRLVVLCGHNEQLRQRLAHIDGALALGWREDLPALFATASVLVDNAGGTTCAEAFAAGLPVVSHQPIAGHGRFGLRALVAAGLVRDGHADLPGAVRALCAPGFVRDAQCRRARRVFRADPAGTLLDWLSTAGALQEPVAH